MYKARLHSNQEIPPHRSCFPYSELLCVASERAPATSAQVSGNQGACQAFRHGERAEQSWWPQKSCTDCRCVVQHWSPGRASGSPPPSRAGYGHGAHYIVYLLTFPAGVSG